MIALLFGFVFTVTISIALAKCIGANESQYLGICNEYATYPIWIDDDKTLSNNNVQIVNSWLSQMTNVKVVTDSITLQCALLYPTCIDGVPSRVCRSNCTSIFSNFLKSSNANYNPCNTKIFYDDSTNNGSQCTRIIAASSARETVASFLVLFAVLFMTI